MHSQNGTAAPGKRCETCPCCVSRSDTFLHSEHTTRETRGFFEKENKAK